MKFVGWEFEDYFGTARHLVICETEAEYIRVKRKIERFDGLGYKLLEFDDVLSSYSIWDND